MPPARGPRFSDAFEMRLTTTWKDLLQQQGRVVANGTASLPRPSQATAPEVPEAALLGQIIRCARQSGWKVYHTHDSRHSEAGFPDLVLAKPGREGKEGRLIFAEVKSRTGKLTAPQAQWLDILRHTVPGLEVYTWKPADWPKIEALLCGKSLAHQEGKTA